MFAYNPIEVEVFGLVDDLAVRDSNFCGCDKCRADVAAYALVHVPSAADTDRTVGTVTVEDAMGPAERAMLSARVVEAVGLVKGHPRH